MLMLMWPLPFVSGDAREIWFGPGRRNATWPTKEVWNVFCKWDGRSYPLRSAVLRGRRCSRLAACGGELSLALLANRILFIMRERTEFGVPCYLDTSKVHLRLGLIEKLSGLIMISVNLADTIFAFALHQKRKLSQVSLVFLGFCKKLCDAQLFENKKYVFCG